MLGSVVEDDPAPDNRSGVVAALKVVIPVALSVPVTARGTAVVIGSPSVPMVMRVTPFGLSNKAVAPEVITEGVVTDVVALSVVKAPVVGVVAPTVPLMLIEAVPVRLVTVPLLGVPSAPPLTTNAPAVPVLTPRAVTTPVPVVVVLGAAPAPPPITNALAASAEEDANVPAAV